MEGFEPSAYGFGDYASATRSRVSTGYQLDPDREGGSIADPGGAGNDGSAAYFTQIGASATFPSSVLLLSPGGDALTLQLNGACTGSGCASLAPVKNVTFTYVPPTTITDAAGNPAGGSFVKTQTMW